MSVLGERADFQRRGQRTRMWTMPLLPLLGLPLVLLAPKKEPLREATAPKLRGLDESDGILELVSPIYRRDWDGGGILRYRRRFYRLDRIGQEGRDWVYRFERCSGDQPDGRKLSLMPPPATPYVPRHAESEPPSILRTALVTAAVTLGPRSDQELWGAHLGVRPIWLTLMGAGAELVGGLVNLRTDIASGGPVLLMLDFFLVGEGLLRLGSVAKPPLRCGFPGPHTVLQHPWSAWRLRRPWRCRSGPLLRPAIRGHLARAMVRSCECLPA